MVYTGGRDLDYDLTLTGFGLSKITKARRSTHLNKHRGLHGMIINCLSAGSGNFIDLATLTAHPTSPGGTVIVVAAALESGISWRRQLRVAG